jgi:2',3'-cyclic-nucleotide 2'-phosphodiesterase (5'-nucleotidase family)
LLIIGGHSEILQGPYPSIATNFDGEEVFVVTAYRWREYLGFIDVELDYRDKIVSYKGVPSIHLTKYDRGITQIDGRSHRIGDSLCRLRRCYHQPHPKAPRPNDLPTRGMHLGAFTTDALEDYRPDVIGGRVLLTLGVGCMCYCLLANRVRV